MSINVIGESTSRHFLLLGADFWVQNTTRAKHRHISVVNRANMLVRHINHQRGIIDKYVLGTNFESTSGILHHKDKLQMHLDSKVQLTNIC